MSKAAKLFYHQTDTETLYRRICPSPDQMNAQKERWNDLREFLVERLTEDSSYPISSWLQGSYKFGTQIRPWMHDAEFDIDLGIYFGWAGRPSVGNHKPEELKALVQAALQNYRDDDNEATEVTDPKERCNRIRFEPDFHIDVPSYHLDADRDARSLATETNSWEKSDPKAIYTWFKGSAEDDERKRLRRQVRYLKMWAALRLEEETRPSSILLTVLAAEAFQTIDTDTVKDDDDLLEAIATVLADRLDKDVEVPNPVDNNEDLNRLSIDATVALVAKLRDLTDIAERARTSTDVATAAEIWSEAFDQFFPMPEDTDEGTRMLAEAQLPAVFRYTPDVEVIATPRDNRHASFSGVNEIHPVPKECDISFRIRNPGQLPAGSNVKWTVRNRGKEAEEENDLGHVAGHGLSVERHTAYNGDHAMDIAVFLHGKPVGRRRIIVKVRGAPVPPRQLPRKRQFIRR